MRKWIHLLCSKPDFRVIINNFIGSRVNIHRGIRQGCPLSPLLYSICAEGFASLLRNDCIFRGIASPTSDYSFRLNQHADDTTVFIWDNEDFHIIEEIIDTYCKGSGSKLNATKTKGLWKMEK